MICPFDRDRRILQYLVTTPVFSEDGQGAFKLDESTKNGLESHERLMRFCFLAAELHLASYESEGPENNMEKDSRRSLRWVDTRDLTEWLD